MSFGTPKKLFFSQNRKKSSSRSEFSDKLSVSSKKKLIEDKKKSNKNRRSLNTNKNRNKQVTLIGTNCAGLSSKLKSFEILLNQVKPSIFFLQETKMKREGKIKVDNIGDFQVYELVRNSKQGGGLAIGVLNELKPAFIREGDDETEIMVVEVKLNGIQTRCINGYGPQDTDSSDRKTKFWRKLEFEVEDAFELEKADGWKSPCWYRVNTR